MLTTGDFHFVVMAQRFTDAMRSSANYLNDVSRVGHYSLIELVRLDSPGPTPTRAYAAAVILTPGVHKSSARTKTRTSEDEFLAAIPDPSHRSALSELFATATALGLVQHWGVKGTSIRLQTPDRNEPLTIAWAFLPNDGWLSAKHVTFGVDPTSLAACPSMADAVRDYCAEVARLPGGVPAGGSLSATVFTTEAFPAVKASLVEILGKLVVSAPV